MSAINSPEACLCPIRNSPCASLIANTTIKPRLEQHCTIAQYCYCQYGTTVLAQSQEPRPGYGCSSLWKALRTLINQSALSALSVDRQRFPFVLRIPIWERIRSTSYDSKTAAHRVATSKVRCGCIRI
eukprot:2720990-Pleurochrysis_carterae.AAC.7